MSRAIIPFKDPSGLLRLLVKVLEMFLIGMSMFIF